jgi:hypothetical protein
VSQIPISPVWEEPNKSTFIRDAHQLLAWGYEDAIRNGKISFNDDETTITGHIVKAIEDRLRNPNTNENYDRYEVHENKPDNKTERVGKYRPLPDIIIRYIPKPFGRPEFTFEAKRLKSNGHPIGIYVGADGLQCYTRCDYASDCEAAAMVAYLQSHTPKYWFNQLSKRRGIALTKVEVLPCLPHEWTSEHMRDNNRSITIYHIFLNCIEDC